MFIAQEIAVDYNAFLAVAKKVLAQGKMPMTDFYKKVLEARAFLPEGLTERLEKESIKNALPKKTGEIMLIEILTLAAVEDGRITLIRKPFPDDLELGQPPYTDASQNFFNSGGIYDYIQLDRGA